MAESQRHKQIKSIISTTLGAEGWRVEEEARRGNVRPDCFAAKGERKVAFEVELANPSMESIKSRSVAYEKQDLPCVWLVRKTTKFPTHLGFSVFPLESRKGKEYAFLDRDKDMPLEDFLRALVNKQIVRRRPLLDRQRLGAIMTFPFECYKCNQTYTARQGIVVPQCVCGDIIGYTDEMPDFVFKREMQKTFDPLFSPFGPPAFFSSRTTSVRKDEPYYVAHCPFCNSVQGNFYLQTRAGSLMQDESAKYTAEYLQGQSSDMLHSYLVENNRLIVSSDIHWCMSRKGL